MSTNISAIIPKKEIKLSDLSGKKIAIDTYLALYQFLRVMPPFTDRKGRITSHLVGLFFRTTHFMALGIKPCFVFDGEILDVGQHKKKVKSLPAPRITGTITLDVIQSTQNLLNALGLPIIQSPSEGEAQAAYMVRQGDVWACGTQDLDALLFGAPRVILNLTFAERRRTPSNFVHIRPCLIELNKVFKKLKINQEKLIMLGILSGTDWNPNVPGIGPKKALFYVKRYKNFDRLCQKIKCQFGYSWKEIFNHIKTMPVTNNYKLKWQKPNKKKILKLLCGEYDFNENRVMSALTKITN